MDIFLSTVFTRIEMSTNVLAHVPSMDYRKVPFESVHQRSPSLTNILFTTSFAGDAVNQVGAFASHVFLALILFLGVVTSNRTTVVYLGAVLTILCLASVDGITAWCPLCSGILCVFVLPLNFR